MKSLRSVIVDDEMHCRSALKKQLEWYCPEVEVVGEAHSASSGIEIIKKEKPDIIFLDIEMPEGTGFEMLEQLGRVEGHVIFTTAYDEYALEAFKVNAIDYILKPIAANDLEQAVAKAKTLKIDDMQDRLENLLTSLKEDGEASDIVAIPVSDGLEFVNISDIIRCESEGAYCHIYIQDRSKIFISKTLKQMEQKINSNKFIRVHHSHLINIEYIKKYVRGQGGHVIMKDDTVVPVSKGRKDNLLDLF